MISRGERSRRASCLEEAGDRRIARNAGCVRQQMNETHVAPMRRRVGIMARDPIVEREPALFHQLQDGGGGELLGERAEAEFALRLMRDIPFAVGEAKALAKQNGIARGNEHRAGEEIGRDEIRDEVARGSERMPPAPAKNAAARQRVWP